MKFIRNIINKLKNSPKRTIVATLAVSLFAVPAIVFAGFGPSRPVFDWNDPNDRPGSTSGPVFNSFINTPTYGDERNFVRVAPVVDGQAPTQANFTEQVTAEPGEEYWVRTFVHNNANQSTNESGLGVAENTRVRMLIADGPANGIDVMSHISADNATPELVWDTGTFANSEQRFNLEYVNGSARLYNIANQGGIALSDAIVSDNGVQIGYNAMNGDLPGCFEFAAYVYARVRVEAPAIDFEKLVRLDGENSSQWRNRVEASEGDRVEYLLDFTNTGTGTAYNIVLRDRLPENMELVPGSVLWIDGNYPEGVSIPDDYLFSSNGFGVGNYGVNNGGYIFYEAVVREGVSECEAINVAFIGANDIPEQSDDAIVVIEDCEQVEPQFVCDALTADHLGDRRYRFNARHTVSDGAEFSHYIYNFGDGSTPLVTDNNTVEYTYPRDGRFTATLTVVVNIDGQQQTDDGPECMVNITVGQEVPEELPDTGIGSLAGVFVATSAIGTLAHKFVLSRRYR